MRLIQDSSTFSLAPTTASQPSRGNAERPTYFHVDQLGGAAVVTFHVLSLRERQATLVAPQLRHVASRSGWNLIVDVSGVVDFTSSWLNVLMHIATDCKARRGGLVILGASPLFESLIENSGLSGSLSLAKNSLAALSKLGLSPVSPWRLAVASLLEIPVALPTSRQWTLADWGNPDDILSVDESAIGDAYAAPLVTYGRAAA